jgi:hypothetical protein
MNTLFPNDDEMCQDAGLQDRVIRIIKPLISEDAEDRVKRSCKQWNLVVRDHIRNETGLRLTDGDTRGAIPVKVVEGFAEPLAELINKFSDPVLWRLILGQPKLDRIIEGLNYFLDGWQSFEDWPKLPEVAKGGREYLKRSLEITHALQQLTVIEEVQHGIKEIDHDILGAYYFTRKNGPEIEIYWMAIAMVAAMLALRIEDLTAVVLVHELAHGYTHIGHDIDGIQWDSSDFGHTDSSIVEGLAQFYTEVVVTRLEGRAPGQKISYERFLEMQSGPYLAHREWFKSDSAQKGEIVRRAMVTARRNGVTSKDEWQTLLESAKEDLRSGRGTSR